MAERVGWGILGTGKIAVKFTDDLRHVPGAALTAVGSRSTETAEAFGRRFRIPHRHATYEALVNDPDVDVVYISTPHSLHAENARLALEAGKAVVCEKPFTLNARQAADLIARARERGLFLMEAMWMRFLPAIVHVRQMVAEKTLGDVRLISADFGLQFAFDPAGRLYAPELGGAHCSTWASTPCRWRTWSSGGRRPSSLWPAWAPPAWMINPGSCCATPEVEIAVLHTAMGVATPTEAAIIGTLGRLRLHSHFYCTDDLTLSLPGKPDRDIHHRRTGNGLHYQAMAVMESLRQGRLESETMPLSESLAVMETLDAIRAQWGLRYPGE